VAEPLLLDLVPEEAPGLAEGDRLDAEYLRRLLTGSSSNKEAF
jgi:hypothetical protein